MQESYTEAIERRFNAFWEDHGLPRKHILLGFSGGVDSVVLAQLMLETDYTFAIAHINFKLRGAESDADQQWVRDWAAAHEIKCFTTSFPTQALAEEAGVSIQMKARELRYAYFQEIAEREDLPTIATAHHQHDLAETILLNLTKGTGIKGLHGILVEQENLIRPLLCLNKAEVLRYATAKKLQWRQDSSNQETYYLRNRIRHEVVPVLESINPNFAATMVRNAFRLRGTEQLARRGFEEIYERMVGRNYPDSEQLNYVRLRNELESPEEQLAFLIEWLAPYHFSIGTLLELLDSYGTENGRQFHSPTHTVVKSEGDWRLIPNPPEGLPVQTIETDTQRLHYGRKAFRFRTFLRPKNLRFSPKQLALDADTLQFPLAMRPWEEGERFQPLGMEGKSQKVADFLMHQKVNGIEKKDFAVLVDAQNKIVGLPEFRPDHAHRVRPETRLIWVLERTR